MSQYNDDSIKVLEGLEAVRKRPGMYIGTVNSTGLHHLIWEVFDNAVDEVVAGFANQIKITLRKDQTIIIEDNGRGIPTGVNKSTGISTVDTVFTVLHAGGKFDESAYKTAGGLHGVGASVVNALSEFVVVRIKKDGKLWEASYVNGGKIKQPLHVIKNDVVGHGTLVWFKPDKTIFKETTTFNAKIIQERIQESSYLYSGLKITFDDENTGKTVVFEAKEGIKEYVKFINANEQHLNNSIFYMEGTESFLVDNKKAEIYCELALQYNNTSNETIVSFANSVKTREGGTYVVAFKTALTELINSYARKFKLIKDNDKNFDGEDVREGIVTVISVRVPERLIQYKSQTKDELSTPEAGIAIKKIFTKKFSFFLEENKKEAEKIINKIVLARDARIAAKKAREDVKALKQTGKRGSLKGSKLTPCQSNDYEKNELFLVEGDSAGGTAKNARNKAHQAILPLRGKIINVEKAKLKDLLANEEINTIITAIGGGIGSEFNIKNIRYGKVIIMTDADVDGSHIQTLLLTFFYRFMKPLIEQGHVYIAMPPLYKFTNNNSKSFKYVWENSELEALKNETKNFSISRYKGLGEMNANQLKETTMGDTRQIIQVSLNDIAIAERRICILMGDNAQIRKEWIDENVDFSFNGE